MMSTSVRIATAAARQRRSGTMTTGQAARRVIAGGGGGMSQDVRCVLFATSRSLDMTAAELSPSGLRHRLERRRCSGGVASVVSSCSPSPSPSLGCGILNTADPLSLHGHRTNLRCWDDLERALPSRTLRSHSSFFGPPPATAGTTTATSDDSDSQSPPTPEWHDPRFMEGRSAEEKERWLEGMLGISASLSLPVESQYESDGGDSNLGRRPRVGQQTSTRRRKEGDGGRSGRHGVDVEAYNVVLRGWAESGSPAAPFRAEEWLCRLRGEAAFGNGDVDVDVDVDDDDEAMAGESSSSSSGSFRGALGSMEPNVDSYNAVLEAWSKSGEAISVVRAERWLVELEDRRSSLLARIDDEEEESSSDASNTANGDDRATPYLEMLERMCPNTESYNHLLSTCARGLGRHDEARLSHALMAHDALHRMLAGDGEGHGHSGNGGNDGGKGGTGTSASSTTTTAKVAKAMAYRLCRPDTESFNRVMTAWTKCRREPTVAVRVMELLRTMEEMQRQDYEREDDGSSSAATTTGGASDLVVAPRVRPNTQSYSIAINAWGIAAEQRAREGRVGRNRPATGDADGSRRRRRPGGSGGGGGRGRDGPRHFDGLDEVLRAEAILSYMHDIRDGGNPDVVPNTVAYNSLIAAFARTVDANNVEGCLRAERVLREMIDLSESGDPNVVPDHFSYSTIIHAWVKTKKLNSTKRAEWWLRRMWKHHDEATCAEERARVAPNAFTYNTVIRSWCDRGDARRADTLLRELLDLEQRRRRPEGEEGVEGGKDGSGDSSVSTPQIFANSDTYALVIGAWVRHEANASPRPGGDAGKGCERAEKLLVDLIDREDRGLPGNTTATELYNNVLKAASLSASRSKGVLNVAIRTFARLDESRHVADNLSYKMLLQTGLRVLARSPDDAKRRGKLVRYVITECCSAGVLCRGIVNALANSSVYRDGWTADERDGLVEELLGEWPIPQSWTRNLSDPGIAPVRKDFRWIEEVDDDPSTERIKY